VAAKPAPVAAKPAPVSAKPAVVVAVVKAEPKKKTVAAGKTAVKVPPLLLEGDVPAAPPVSGPGQRYALGPSAPPAHVPEGEVGELPEAYGTKRLLLAARDPHWLYACWDLTDEQQRQYNRLAKAGHLALRVFVQGSMGQPLSEVEVHPESRNWFLHVGKGGGSYVAKLGYRDRKGAWVEISGSQATMTPPDAMSDDTSAQFATVPLEVSFAKLIEVVKEAVQENVSLAQAIQQVAREQIEAAGPQSSSAALATGAFPPPTGAAAPGHWTPAQEQALSAIVSMDAVRRVWIGSLEITELVRRRLEREWSSMAAVPAGPGAAVPSSLGSLASPFGGAGAPAARGFWFNVNAELVVYGATEPDATVTIGGRPIKLRKDGSFSYRFALPDGRYELPIMAVSVDRSEGRAADLHFMRQTEYQGDVGIHPQDPALEPPLPENVQ
jgi:hypothetical protein